MLKQLRDIGWIVAFLALCAFYVSEVMRASRHAELAKGASEEPGWICPIAGRCGPAGTPGLGRW
jgi:hypothetical protein